MTKPIQNQSYFPSFRLRSLASSLALAISMGTGGVAWAQMGGGMGGMGPGMGPAPGPQKEKEEGPAEAAPEEEGKSPAQAEAEAGYAGQKRRKTKVIELDGYFRVRTNFLHNFNLGQGYHSTGDASLGTPPFPQPLECGINQGGCPAGEKNLGDGNLRLRLEPTINISDQVRVVSQIDVLDNLIMGSTPDSLMNLNDPTALSRTNRAGADALSNTQETPDSTRNSYMNSVRAKRAWAEVDSELGSLRFGRMPWHFGRGLYFNSGNCMDCDGGTTVDRIMAITQIYGHQLAVSWDFGPQGYTFGTTTLGRLDSEGPPLDLSQNDDVLQLTASLTRVDGDRQFRERVANGELVLNYGLQFVYRNQGKQIDQFGAGTAERLSAQGAPTITDLINGWTASKTSSATIVVPSAWFKLGWKALTLEFEATAVAGRYDQAGWLRDAGPGTTTPSTDPLKLFQLGWVLASELRLYHDSLFLGFETGGATGDDAELAYTQDGNGNLSGTRVQSYLNQRWKLVPQPVGDSWSTAFLFSPQYHVDEIFFRRIMGTVTNAVYLKPSATYWFDLGDPRSSEQRQLGLNGSFIYSLAPWKDGTPGNGLSYGLEMDLSLMYRNTSDNFYAGLTWGVFWALDALNRPGTGTADTWLSSEGTSAAQILRAFLGVRF
jgi:uncharacterized protein (TIGR04551 family)